MRVIEENKVEKIHKCCFCRSLIAYKYTDIHEDIWDMRYIKCPVCKEKQSPSIFDRKVKK